MGPLSEHFRSSEALAELREAEIARKFARRQALGLPGNNAPRRPSVLRAIAGRLGRGAPAAATAFEPDRDSAIDGVRPAKA